MGVVADAARRRRSRSKVTDEAPTHEQLLECVQAAATVADHSSLRPWRLIELRGDDRLLIGRSLAEACEADGRAAEKLEQKSLRAPLVLAVVLSPVESRKVPEWEQESVASGVAHLLSLVLDDEGWGVFWRTGTDTRHEAVHRGHGLAPHEKLLGWLYVGGRTDRDEKPRKLVEPGRFVSAPGSITLPA
jgi:nitroreductase